eukprot:TRINITY_DN23184_c0_g1_i1.p1 TRINITY_DN23184_c0_g1~~TRINITY_DN23184_c0_g1_i1.p1  ORF type:complete len:103 (-),score=24.45 TRINITY_DN23184_c0_g1_i1:37-345(-)
MCIRDSSPLLCIHGFDSGHAAIAWLDANPTSRVALLQPLQNRHQNGAHAFVEALYPGRLLLLDQAIGLLRERGCRAVHVSLTPDEFGPVSYTHLTLPTIYYV